MTTYSFADVQCTIKGPGGTISIAQAMAGVADEGISVVHSEDKSTMNVGADGAVMHSLHVAEPGTVTIRLQKTSQINNQLMTMYNYQRQSSLYWGQNIIVVSNPVMGDSATQTNCAFKKAPDFNNPKIAGMVEWSFDAGNVNEILMAGPAVT